MRERAVVAIAVAGSSLGLLRVSVGSFVGGFEFGYSGWEES